MLNFAGDAKHVESIFGNELHLTLLCQSLVFVNYEEFHVAFPARVDYAPAHVLPRLFHNILFEVLKYLSLSAPGW